MDDRSLCTDDCTEKVIRHYADMIYRLAFARCGSKYDAEEIFQEVFLRYVKKQPVFQDEEHRKAWLIRVTINCSKKNRNSAWRKKSCPLEDNLIFESEESIGLYHELQKLPAKYREVIHLFYYEDMSIKEISKVLEISEGTVKSRLSRAKSKLKALLKEEI